MQRTNHQRKKKTSQYQKKQEHVLRAINTSEYTYHILVLWKHEAIFLFPLPNEWHILRSKPGEETLIA